MKPKPNEWQINIVEIPEEDPVPGGLVCQYGWELSHNGERVASDRGQFAPGVADALREAALFIEYEEEA